MSAKLIEEFKAFAIKGNAVDMAAGIMLGTAFNGTVNSLINDIFMPPIGWILGGVEFKHLQFVIQPADGHSDGVAIRYGAFINTLIQFLIVALTLFVVIKVMSRLIAQRPPAESGTPKIG